MAKHKYKPKKVRNHDWYQISRTLPRMFCGRCGLINLNNDVTRRAMEKPCKGLEEEDTE